MTHAGTDPNLSIRDSSAHKFKTFVLYYLNSRAEMWEREGKQLWNLPSVLGYLSDLHKEPLTKHSSASQTGIVSNEIAVAFDILGGA